MGKGNAGTFLYLLIMGTLPSIIIGLSGFLIGLIVGIVVGMKWIVEDMKERLAHLLK